MLLPGFIEPRSYPDLLMPGIKKLRGKYITHSSRPILPFRDLRSLRNQVTNNSEQFFTFILIQHNQWKPGRRVGHVFCSSVEVAVNKRTDV